MLATALSSLVVIIVLHYLYIFLRDALTVPKIRDMVRKPQARCLRMLDGAASSVQPTGPPGATQRPLPIVPDKTAMQAELGAFLRELKQDGGAAPRVPSRAEMG